MSHNINNTLYLLLKSEFKTTFTINILYAIEVK